MLPPNTDTKVKFNYNIHGMAKGQIVTFGKCPYALQILIRRRLRDNDGSVEIVEVQKENKLKPETKPAEVKVESKNTSKKS